MEKTLSRENYSGSATLEQGDVSPMLSADSARGALLWFGLTFLTAVVGGWASASSSQFYDALQLPQWAPPPTVFGPVWSALYLLMGAAAWFVWRHRQLVRGSSGLVLYGIALLPNALWTWVSFAGVLNAVLWWNNPTLLG